MNKLVFNLLLMGLCCYGFDPTYAQTPGPEKVAFNWAFVYKQKDGQFRSWDEQQPVAQLAAGDRIKFFLQPLRNAYIYLYLYDTEKRLFLLFPGSNNFFQAGYRQTGEYYVPEGSTWLSVNDDSGVETFYLLVSRKRLGQLEALTAAFFELDASATAASRPLGNPSGLRPGQEVLDEAKQAVLDEIRNVKNQYSIFQGLVEKPIIIAGDYRGGNDIRSFIKAVEVDNFYAKIIRLAH